MTIEDTTIVFPNNIVNLLAGAVPLAVDPDLFVAKRMLRESDPAQSVGVIATQWVPDDDSYEMNGAAVQDQPTLQTYLITVQAFIKDFDEARGAAKHTILSKLLRSMLYADPTLRVGLRALSVSMGGSVERTQRWGIRSQRFLANEIDGDFLYLSTLEFWLETETV